jgi:myo-inositol-1(or 4)-monophosphatase
MSRADDLRRIERAIDDVSPILLRFADEGFRRERKASGDWVTEANLEIDDVLRESLVRDDEAWLSEETADNLDRLAARRVWIVDPLDGTKEFVQGIPEWCVSIALVEDGVPVAGGISNPAAGLRVTGALGAGCFRDGIACQVEDGEKIDGIEVLASRSEVARGEWDRFEENGFTVVPTGSVAYKLALVAAGSAGATWTLTPKSEWDVAAGVALVHAAGGRAVLPDGSAPVFNRENVILPGLIAAGKMRMNAIQACLSETR